MEWNYSWSLQRTNRKFIIKTVFDGRIYSLKITCGPEYPEKAPQLRFINKINIPCVNQGNGKVEKLDLLNKWKNTTTIENILQAIKT